MLALPLSDSLEGVGDNGKLPVVVPIGLPGALVDPRTPRPRRCHRDGIGRPGPSQAGPHAIIQGLRAGPGRGNPAGLRWPAATCQRQRARMPAPCTRPEDMPSVACGASWNRPRMHRPLAAGRVPGADT